MYHPSRMIIMKTTLKGLWPALLLLSLTLGCSVINQLKKQAEADKKPQVIASADNKIQLIVPASWDKSLNINNDATLQAGNHLMEQYAIVISDYKRGLPKGMTLAQYTDAIRESLKKNVMVVGLTMTDVETLTINGYSATRFEAQGTTVGTDIKWIYTIFGGTAAYHQVLAWSAASKFEGNKQILLEVANSFKEVD